MFTQRNNKNEIFLHNFIITLKKKEKKLFSDTEMELKSTRSSIG